MNIKSKPKANQHFSLKFEHQRRIRFTHHTSVIGGHAGAKGVEDADHPGVNILLLSVREGQGLRNPLGLVITGTWANGVDVSPIILALGVDLWITIHLYSPKARQFFVNLKRKEREKQRLLPEVEAIKNLALTLLANPNMLIVPMVLVLIVFTGLYWY